MTFSTSPDYYDLAYITSVFISGYIGTDSIGSLIKRFAAKKAGVEDGKINNQRKAFLDIAGVVGGNLITDVRKPESHGYDVIADELFTSYSDHPRKLVTLNPKLKSTGAGRYQLLPVGGITYRKQLGLKTSLRKVRTVALQQIKERGALPMIDRGDIRQAIDRCSNIWASLRALVMVSSNAHKADSLIAKFKEAERNGQRD